MELVGLHCHRNGVRMSRNFLLKCLGVGEKLSDFLGTGCRSTRRGHVWLISVGSSECSPELHHAVNWPETSCELIHFYVLAVFLPLACYGPGLVQDI